MNLSGTAAAYGPGEFDDRPGDAGLLLVSCRPGEGIVLPGPHVSVRVIAVMSDRVRIGVEAPGGARVVRAEARCVAAPLPPPAPYPT